ncbi:uncharacterized protein EV422DRAFT_151001 [Fimicolochytrium jonesii]|uniref:uncharacterized protein n=1 Tax=Fimicolochytrium jonesii TaxID=1396493 RepID=UPI0022FF43A2|nr:uncharacterized protein EV422DRAFT_151001 [Fimicolochytrium jonesii]KAI8826048.1 hypothetical protein EV422DRAFT_151001 [Fimicolochytrium jonesii]
MTVNSDSIAAILVTGANRGIGLGLVKAFAERPNTIVFATARNPAKSEELQAYVKQHTNVHILKLEATSDEDHKKVAEEIKKVVNGLDVVVINAGISSPKDGYGSNVSIEAFRETLEVNTLGPLRGWQAFSSLLKAKQTRKFFVISSLLGSITEIPQAAEFPTIAYNTSKSAVNSLTRKLAYENKKDNFSIQPLHPGWVATDMGNTGAAAAGLKEAPVKVPDSVKGLVALIDKATPENTGTFWGFDGQEIAW